MESINDNNETWNEPIDFESLDVEKEFGPFSELEQSIYFLILDQYLESMYFLRQINTRIEELKQKENDELSPEPSSKRTHTVYNCLF